jgi:SAM-dependent methyltransferase
MTTPKDNNDSTRLIGFDTAGELFLNEEKIYRKVFRNYVPLYRHVLEICRKNDLFEKGIVTTRELKDRGDLEPEFGLLLEHERIRFITYPHEWSASMLRDAAGFHIDLFGMLERYGLTLKDWHPYNVLFTFTEPVFVDFFSIIPIDDLEKEEYLSPPKPPAVFSWFWDTRSKYLFEMYRRMYIPYFLLPLTLMAQKRQGKARELLLATTLNASARVIAPGDVFEKRIVGRLRYEFREGLKKIYLCEGSVGKHNFFSRLLSEQQNLDVKPDSSAYVRYYELKNENFDVIPTPEWTNKQRAVNNAIQEFKPGTVLDIACNTGWFSILAAKNGCDVVAVDIDESCVDKLYEYAKNERLHILPLVLDISHAADEVFPSVEEGEPYHKRLTGRHPLIIAAEKRLQCDMVLILALVHHLVLGQNTSFSALLDIVNSLARHSLVLEFVPKDDELVVGDPDFFPAYRKNPGGFEWYTLENLVSELEKAFSTITIVDSYPETRKLLICKK